VYIDKYELALLFTRDT